MSISRQSCAFPVSWRLKSPERIPGIPGSRGGSRGSEDPGIPGIPEIQDPGIPGIPGSYEEAKVSDLALVFGDTQKWPKTYIYIYVERPLQALPKGIHLGRLMRPVARRDAA